MAELRIQIGFLNAAFEHGPMISRHFSQEDKNNENNRRNKRPRDYIII